MRNQLLSILFLFLLLTFSTSSKASHYMGGYITWECITQGPHSGKVVFKLVLYRDCNGLSSGLSYSLKIINYNPDTIITMTRFESIDISPYCDASTGFRYSCGIGPPYGSIMGNGAGAIERTTFYSDTIRLQGVPPTDGWILTWTNCCRNSAVVNFPSPSGEFSTLHSIIYPFTPSGGSSSLNMNQCYDQGPQFFFEHAPIYCVGPFQNDRFTAYDNDSDSLKFEVTEPLLDLSTFSGWTYDPSNPLPSQNPEPWFPYPGYPQSNLYLPDQTLNQNNAGATLDSSTGLISGTNWTIGSFVIPIMVHSYRDGQLISSIHSESEHIFTSCDTNLNPTITVFPVDSVSGNQHFIYVNPFDTVQFQVNCTDPDVNIQQLNFNWNSVLFLHGNESYQQSPHPTTQPAMDTIGNEPINAFFSWATTANHLDTNNLIINETIPIRLYLSDGECPLPNQVNAVVNLVMSNNLPLFNSNEAIYKCPLDTIALTPTGGQNFYWSTSDTANFINVVDTGVYQVFYDSLGWTFYDEITVLFYPDTVKPDLIADTLFSICIDPIQFNLGTAFPQYEWNLNGTISTGSSISLSDSGTYQLRAIDSLGCASIDSFKIIHLNYTNSSPNPICRVSVDSGYCDIIFKDPDPGLTNMDVYKFAGGTGSYNLISQFPYTNSFGWTDSTSTPLMNSESYRVKTIDSCGNTSDFKVIHSSIWLKSWKQGNNFYLVWSNYSGRTVDHQELFVSYNSGPFTHLLNLNQLNSDYFFSNPSNSDATFFIQARLNNTNCSMSPGDTLGNYSRSNLSASNEFGISDNRIEVSIYPNPSSGEFRIESDHQWNRVEVYDLSGKLIVEREWQEELVLDLTNHPAGLYSLILINSKNRQSTLIEKLK